MAADNIYRHFESGGFSCGAEFLHSGNAWAVRFYDDSGPGFKAPLANLVTPPDCYGFLHLQCVGEDGVFSGFLDAAHFSPDMTEDLLALLEETIFNGVGCYLPYHIDFVTLQSCEEYNGEY